MDRRSFLQLMGAKIGAAALSTTGCSTAKYESVDGRINRLYEQNGNSMSQNPKDTGTPTRSDILSVASLVEEHPNVDRNGANNFVRLPEKGYFPNGMQYVLNARRDEAGNFDLLMIKYHVDLGSNREHHLGQIAGVGDVVVKSTRFVARDYGCDGVNYTTEWPPVEQIGLIYVNDKLQPNPSKDLRISVGNHLYKKLLLEVKTLLEQNGN